MRLLCAALAQLFTLTWPGLCCVAEDFYFTASQRANEHIAITGGIWRVVLEIFVLSFQQGAANSASYTCVLMSCQQLELLVAAVFVIELMLISRLASSLVIPSCPPGCVFGERVSGRSTSTSLPAVICCISHAPCHFFATAFTAWRGCVPATCLRTVSACVERYRVGFGQTRAGVVVTWQTCWQVG